MRPFQAAGGAKSLSCSTSSARVALDVLNALAPKRVRVYNSGTVIVFVKFGDSTVTAALTDHPIPPSSFQDLVCPSGATHICGITASGTATLYGTEGY